MTAKNLRTSRLGNAAGAGRRQSKGDLMKILHVLGVAGACLGFGFGLGCKAPAETAVKVGDVTEARVAAESGAGANWLLNGRTFDEAHFSPLTQITDKNVSGLG